MSRIRETARGWHPCLLDAPTIVSRRQAEAGVDEHRVLAVAEQEDVAVVPVAQPEPEPAAADKMDPRKQLHLAAPGRSR